MPWGSGGVPCQVQPGGYPAGGGTLARGGTLVRYPPWSGQDGGYPAGGGRGVPCQVQPGGYPAGGVPWLRGVPWSDTPPGQVRMGGYPGLGGVPWSGTPPSQVRMGEGTLPGGRYPGRTTEGVLTTRRAVCLLRSRRRTFLSYRILLYLEVYVIAICCTGLFNSHCLKKLIHIFIALLHLSIILFQ